MHQLLKRLFHIEPNLVEKKKVKKEVQHEVIHINSIV